MREDLGAGNTNGNVSTNDPAFSDLPDTEMTPVPLKVKPNQKHSLHCTPARPGITERSSLMPSLKAINLTNRVFTMVVNATCDYAGYDPNTQRPTIGVAIAQVELRYGVHHANIGHGRTEHSKSNAAGFSTVRITHQPTFSRSLSSISYLPPVRTTSCDPLRVSLIESMHRGRHTGEAQKHKPPPPASHILCRDHSYARTFRNSSNWIRIRCTAGLDSKPNPHFIVSAAGLLPQTDVLHAGRVG